jgi:hypothetical protein
MKFPNSIKDANSIILRSRCHICCTWNHCDSGKSAPLIIVRATKVVAALGADQLAMVAGEAVAAGGADLAVVVNPIHWTRSRSGVCRFTWWEIDARIVSGAGDEVSGKIRIEGAGTLRQHG